MISLFKRSQKENFTRFFDEYPRFYKTSLTGSDAEWNNRRYKILIDGCRDEIAGKRVLDFGSHDGRWSFAALKAGATHVTCIEPGEVLVASTRENFDAYGVDSSQYSIAQTGAVEFVERSDESADTAFLFGMLTLVSEQPAFFAGLRRMVRTLIIDTHIIPNEERPIFELFRAAVQDGNAIIPDKTHHDGWMMGTTPSLPALRTMLEHFGWAVTLLDWSKLQTHPDMNDYSIGRRVSLVARS